MEQPTGEADDGSLRVDFDRRLKRKFHDSRITSDAGARTPTTYGRISGRTAITDR